MIKNSGELCFYDFNYIISYKEVDNMSISNKIKENFNNFSKTDIKISNYILENITEIKTLTSLELAKRISVGQSTIIKFVKKIGFKGYGNFKETLITQLVKEESKVHRIHGDISLEDSTETVLKKIGTAHSSSIENTLENLNLDSFTKTIELMNKANKVIIIGIGSSSLVGVDFEQKLIKLGKIAIHSLDTHVQGMHVATASKNDVIFIISHSGETQYIKSILDGIDQKTRPKLVLLTNSSNSSLATISDIVISTNVNNNFIRSSALSSRIAQLTVIDALYIEIFRKNSKVSFKLLDKSIDIISKLNNK